MSTMKASNRRSSISLSIFSAFWHHTRCTLHTNASPATMPKMQIQPTTIQLHRDWARDTDAATATAAATDTATNAASIWVWQLLQQAMRRNATCRLIMMNTFLMSSWHMNMHVNDVSVQSVRVCVCVPWRGIGSQAIYYPTRRTVWKFFHFIFY